MFRIRKFKMVSNEEIKKCLGENSAWTDERYREGFILRFKPRRATKYSAAYDLYSPIDVKLKAGEIAKIPSCFKIKMPKDEAFFIYIRSSYGAKDINLPAGVNIIDSDYYNNPDNEGNFYIIIKNNSNKTFTINAGDRIAQGVFQRYYKTVDDFSRAKRKSGLGSTGKNG